MSKNRRSVATGGPFPRSVQRNVEVPLKKSESRRSVAWHPNVGQAAGDNTAGRKDKEDVCPNANARTRRSMPLLTNIKKSAAPVTIDLTEEFANLKLSSKEKDAPSLSRYEMTKHLNFPRDAVVFKDLVPLNVNDSILLPKEKVPLRKKYVSSGNKHPVPDLMDFLDPIQPLEHIIPEPDIKFEVTKTSYDSFSKFSQLFREAYPD